MSRGWETERCRMAQTTAPILDSTHNSAAPGCPRSRRVLEGKRTTLGHWTSDADWSFLYLWNEREAEEEWRKR